MIKDKESQFDKDAKFQCIGWVLFIICSFFYLLSSFKKQDMLTFIGSILFLIACIVFLIPILESLKQSKKSLIVEDEKNMR